VPILDVCGYTCVGCDAAVLHCWDETLLPPAPRNNFLLRIRGAEMLWFCYAGSRLLGGRWRWVIGLRDVVGVEDSAMFWAFADAMVQGGAARDDAGELIRFRHVFSRMAKV
jgi:hypothetical protein